MPSPELVDFDRRFPDLVEALRASAPSASETLRERVASLPEPHRRAPRGRRPSRRVVLVLAGAAGLAAVAAAVIAGGGGGGGGTKSASQQNERALRASPRVVHGGAVGSGSASAGSKAATRAHGKTFSQTSTWGTATVPLDDSTRRALSPSTKNAPSPSALAAPQLPPALNRLQHYSVQMTLRVPDQQALSARTNRAMQLTRRFGGYVVSVHYASRAGAPGDASLLVRVPITKAQQALRDFSALGKIVAQQVGIQDLQPRSNQEQAQIFDLRKTVARIQDQLRDPSLTLEQKVVLQEQLRLAQSRLAAALGTHNGTLREGRLTTMRLALTTRAALGPAVHHGSGSGRIGRAARHALHVLAVVGAALVWILIVASPFLLLAAAAWWGRRTLRRREEDRLLAAQ